MSNETTPRFEFDSPPPFTYEVFKAVLLPKVLEDLEGEGGAFLKGLEGDQAEFLCRLMYVSTVVSHQNPDMTKAQMLYSVFYGISRHYLDQGLTPESAREELTKVPWDTLPGLNDYERESTNSVFSRAFADALAGRPQLPLR